VENGAAREPKTSGPGTARRLSRRHLLGVGAASLALLAAGCGDDDDPAQTPTPAFNPSATPTGFLPGYEDPGKWAGRTLRVAAWGGEVQEALRRMVWEPFSRATGCAIQELTTDYAFLRSGIDDGSVYADALVVDAEFAATALDQGLAQPIDADIETDLVPRAEHSVPAYAYAMVSAYRRDAIDNPTAPPDTWQEWWDSDRFPGARTLFKGAFGSFEFALLADGVGRDALYPLDLDRAIASLRSISGRIIDRWWESGLQPVSWLNSRRAEFASAWHYRVIAAQNEGQPVELVWNEGLLVADHWIVPPGAENADVAADFIAYASRAEVQASLAHLISLGPVNSGAFELLDPIELPKLPTAPDNLPSLVPQDVAWWVANRGAAEERFNSWLLGVA
jgi:putative spermidine/putrescine transport system substrate-binding protein